MTSQVASEAVETTGRYLIGPQFLSIFKGFTLTTIGPIILVVIFTVIVVNILAYLLADSHGPYPQYGRKLALAAVDVWDKRDQYGFPSGRNLNDLGPLESVLDAIATSIKRYEQRDPAPQTGQAQQKTSAPYKAVQPKQQDTSGSAPANFIQSSPQFISKTTSFQNQRRRGATSSSPSSGGGKIRFQ